ncbi:hypothetical protein ACUR5C_01875 [Aliikangiella sp. IMCC44653]
MIQFNKIAGVAAVGSALIYIAAFVYFGVFSAMPSGANSEQVMLYLAEHKSLISMVYFLIYVVFGLLLAVIVVNLNEQLACRSSSLFKIASLFGAIWVGLVIASGMLSTIGLSHAVALIDSNYDRAYDLWVVITVITESIGGGNELVGGIWVLLISIAAKQQGLFSRGLNYLGMLVGVAGIATVYPAVIFTEIFGVTQILWFLWLGIALLSNRPASS